MSVGEEPSTLEEKVIDNTRKYQRLADSLRLRTLPQYNSEAVQIDSVKKGSSFVLKQTKKNADGTQWAFLQVSGTSGGWACISDSKGTYLKVEEV